MVDLTWPGFPRIGPVRDLACLNARKYLLEFGFVDQESVVLANDFAISIEEIEADPVVSFNDQERAKPGGWVETEDFTRNVAEA